MIGGAFLGGGVELVPAGQCKIELQIMTEDRQNLTGTFTLTDGTHTYSATAGADGRASVNVASGGTYTVTISNTGYDNISAQTVVSASATVKYVRFELPTANVKIGGAQTITGAKTFGEVVTLSNNGTAKKFVMNVRNITTKNVLPSADTYSSIEFMHSSGSTYHGFITKHLRSNGDGEMSFGAKDYAEAYTGRITIYANVDGSTFVTASNRPYADAGSSDVLVKGHVASITDLVHTTGNETIAGTKTFTDSIVKTSTVNVNYAIVLKNNLAQGTVPTSDTASGIYMRPADTNNNIGVVSHILNKTSGDGKIELSSRNYNYANKTTIYLVSPGDGSAPYITGPSRTYSASNTSDVVTIASLQASTDLVHTTGNESIAGEKTFTSNKMYIRGSAVKGTIPSSNTYSAFYFRFASGTNNPMYLAHYVMATSGDGEAVLSVYNYNSANQTKFRLVSGGDGSTKYMTGPSRTYSASNTTDIVNIASLESRLNTKITYGTADPSGGSNGDIYLQYEA